MAPREKVPLYSNKASLGKCLKSSKNYPELSEKEPCTPKSKFPLPSVSPEPHLQTLLFQCTNSEQWNPKNQITSAPNVCISEAALMHLKVSFQSEEKQLAQGVSPTESGRYILLSIKLWQLKYWGTRRQILHLLLRQEHSKNLQPASN